jgi:CheY-like chemotaxis protein
MNKNPKVLIVEDSGFFRRALAMNLSHSGFEVLTAVNGNEATHVARTEKPHVIVLDMFMPKLDGMMVLRILRLLPETINIPVILLSGSTKQEDVELARSLGVVEYVPKSLMDFQDLLALIRQHGIPNMLKEERIQEQQKPKDLANCGLFIAPNPADRTETRRL